jgi:Cu+-exporting ATPase
MQPEQMMELEHGPAPPEKATGRVTLRVTGMTCGNCARHVAEAIQRVPGVQNAAVNLDAQEAVVRWRSGAQPETEKVIHAIEEEGFGAKVITAAPHDHVAHLLAGWRLNLLLGIPVTALLMTGEWLLGLSTVAWFQWCSFALATFVQVFAGARFYRGAWSQAKAGSSNMDTLVALGSTTAFGFSVWALLKTPGTHLYFMEASAIITLISVGHWVESRVSQRASSALRQLLNLAPTLTRRINGQGAETEVQVANLKEGERVALRPGDHVPTDGIVEEGASTVNESMLTGESAPVDKRLGSELYAGTVNLNGRLIMRVTATGEETTLAHIIAAVQRAQNSRAQIQRLGDRVSSVFVPVVIAVALMAGLWWGFAPQSALRVHDFLSHFFWSTHPPAGSLAAPFIIAAAVLIIACPCAMGLATPAAIMAGSNAAAQRGILIRDGIALEKAGQITTVLLDKTGTLTVGRPSLVEQWEHPTRNSSVPDSAIDGSGKVPAQSLAIALAQHSSHPVSQAIANLGVNSSAREPSPVELVDWKEVHGAGVQGKLRHLGPDHDSPTLDLARLGSLNWLTESGVELRPGEDFVKTWSSQGATIVGVALNTSLLGLFAISDSIKPGAHQVVQHLQRQGFQTYLVTGDNVLTATTIAAQTGIPQQNVLAEVRPEQKAQFVQKLQQQGKRVAFVGDGINDAPALEQADLGIAVGRASDIAREAADIILPKSEIEAVPESLGLARATLRTIKQNLFWAFFYNVTGIPLAALGFMSPVLCAAAMGLSDLVVLGNALRLRRWRL